MAEEECEFKGFEDWLLDLKKRGIITTERYNLVLRGLEVPPYEGLLIKAHKQVREINEQICSLMFRRDQIEKSLGDKYRRSR